MGPVVIIVEHAHGLCERVWTSKGVELLSSELEAVSKTLDSAAPDHGL